MVHEGHGSNSAIKTFALARVFEEKEREDWMPMGRAGDEPPGQQQQQQQQEQEQQEPEKNSSKTTVMDLFSVFHFIVDDFFWGGGKEDLAILDSPKKARGFFATR